MIVTVDVPDYSPEHDLRRQWDEGSVIATKWEDGTLVVEANREGLLSLARLMLTLAAQSVPPGAHWHLDDSNALEPSSIGLIIERR